MKPTSLPARLLAATPQGRRLFSLLAEQHAEAVRLRKLLDEGEARWREGGNVAQQRPDEVKRTEARKRPEDVKRTEVENTLRWAQETEAATLRMELQQARATAAAMTEAVQLLSTALLDLRGADGEGAGRPGPGGDQASGRPSSSAPSHP